MQPTLYRTWLFLHQNLQYHLCWKSKSWCEIAVVMGPLSNDIDYWFTENKMSLKEVQLLQSIFFVCEF